MKHLGIEIEFTGVKRSDVVKALENLFQVESISVENTSIDSHYIWSKIIDYYGNAWKVLRDRSIRSQAYSKDDRFKIEDIEDESHEYACELVSPILNSTTLPILFTIVDVIRSIGGVVNSSCGIHIHIDKPDVQNLSMLFKKFISCQDNIFDMFNVCDSRQDKYCKKFPADIEVPDFDTDEQLLDWYHNKFSVEKDGEVNFKTSRYYGLNLHSIETHNTIEFRLFNSSLSLSTIANYIKFILNFCYEFDDICNYSIMLERYLQNEIGRVNI